MSGPDDMMCGVHTKMIQKREAGLNHWQGVLRGGWAMLYMKLHNFQMALSFQSVGQVASTIFHLKQ